MQHLRLTSGAKPEIRASVRDILVRAEEVLRAPDFDRNRRSPFNALRPRPHMPAVNVCNNPVQMMPGIFAEGTFRIAALEDKDVRQQKLANDRFVLACESSWRIRRSSVRGMPRGLFGSSGAMISHSRSVRSKRAMFKLPAPFWRV